MDMMSSEEEVESEDETYLSVKSLPWRSRECNVIMAELDKKINEGKSKKAKRMELKRVRGECVSERPVPEDLESDAAWAINI